jgi:lantibiotic modifying enzyme
LQVSGLDAMAERLSACADLAGTDGQLECIRLSVASDASRQLGSFGTPRPTENIGSQESAFGVVEQIVKRLSDTVLETRSGLRWATLRPIKIDQYTVGLTNHTLYDGVAGILLFLSLAAEHLSLERARTLAHRLAAQLTATFDHYAPWYGAGAYDGLPGILYAVERSFPPLGIDSTHFRINCARRILDALPSEGPADVIGGVAGALLISSRVLESTPIAPAERAIWLRIGRACVDALGATAIRCGNEALWRAMIPLKDFPYGFAHGGGGIAYALETWSRLTDDGEASLLADLAARREASGYDDQLGGWVDTRTGKLANYWCYGAAGLLLPFRLLASRSDNEEWTQALSKCEGAAKNYRPQPQSCLCHGSSGIKELIGAAAETTDEGESRFSVDLGLPLGVSTPGLMTGLSGLGIYFLRRYLSPNIGSVLSLEF